MNVKASIRGFLALLLLSFAAAPAQATDGHFLHGVGAVNSAMGGAGVAAPGDLLGSFYLNPAGLMCESGSRVAMGFEMMKAQRSVSSTFGPYAGTTPSKSAYTPIPAFGWATNVGDRLSVGIGMLGIGGFGVDYPQDLTNPILGARPQGFGQVTSNFQFMKISPAVAYKVNDRLALGVALNLDWASLSVDPMPTAPPAYDANTGAAYYSRATATDGAYGLGLQAGLLYRATDAIHLGLAYTSKQSFQDFQYNAQYENPMLPNFQTARSISFAMDVPAVYSGGFAVTKGDLLWTSDARYITYSKTAGFDKSGMDQTGAVQGFGWQDIWVLASGLQYKATQALSLRGGYNFTQNPIPDAQSAFNIPAPAVVQHHLTLGVGFAFDAMKVDMGYYHAFENTITGLFPTPMGNMGVSNSMSEDSFLMTFSFVTGR